MKTASRIADRNSQSDRFSMAERLGLGPEVRELKLGPSFTNNKSTAFHTLKYDFKPASVDVSKMARVDVGTNNTMMVTVPHLDGAGIPHTVFKGSQRPHHKDCVLIIDRKTGEITLEKLSANIQVKKTRTEPKSQLHLGTSTTNNSSTSSSSINNNNRPITPVETKKSPTHNKLINKSRVVNRKKKDRVTQLHPKQSSPRISPYHRKSPPNPTSDSLSMQSSTTQSTLASLPMISSENDDFLMMPPMPPMPPSAVPSMPPSAVPSMPPMPPMPPLSDSSSGSSSSDSSDSDSDTGNAPVSTVTNGHPNNTTLSPTSLMPNNLLNEDLQLSESESDSD
ncbi:PREDICTED: ell-associated factor Eaf [Polistes canadensis]|uniref:ell-associated factor Eaf n=1 Tax=Polistes canadensis TaxID=91411 RepID=UPI000718FF52|nr:PREDICTED: ell-associated factor Eaf [Polistes canadensis]XP_014604684.1 PREDICTED: ell-associated factor Eaf [Polistes canadensis]XP_014604685.1 PREDICTED: ell-associated factor Eaf [Polistes canadensis]XP_014604686.1 PREDICTED: ell-associated factor Eaf [Polistes canadensis]XP_014604687.1 PREDICTED: ell-associated factor Eaf [Polistes canadensis]